MKLFYESERDFSHHKIEVFKTEGTDPHFHAQVEMLCVKSGGIEVTINGETKRMTVGEICVSGSYDVHSYICEDGCNGTAIIFPLDCLQRYFTIVKDRTITRHFITDEKIFAKVCALIDVFMSQDDKSALFEEGWANTVLGILLSALDFTSDKSDGRVDTMREILAYVSTHYEENITLKSVSEKFGYSPYHFSRLFNSFANTNLKKYVNSVRLDAAADKLKNGVGVTDAAFDSGFRSMRSFYRDFTERFGVSPRKYMLLDAKLRNK